MTLDAALRADRYDIYIDMDGVYTVAPNPVPGARKAGRAAYEEMVELASLGAHPVLEAQGAVVAPGRLARRPPGWGTCGKA